ncbi:hypothetical protein RsTz2092_04790 [Deferribacterales bacterium RsTz2092]|nr:hypothetical protein AGMMS49941_02580 [Deferribacterales bacterium]
MKRLFVFFVVAFSAAVLTTNAFALDSSNVKFFGEIELTGYGRSNVDYLKGSDNVRGWSGVYQYAYVGVKLDVDPRLQVGVRALLTDGVWGSEQGAIDPAFDRTWLKYTILDGDSLSWTIEGGILFGGDYTLHSDEWGWGFASGFYEQSPADSGSRNKFRTDVAFGDQSVYLAVEKGYETSLDKHDEKGYDNASDAYAVLLGANLKFDNLYVYPLVSYAVGYNYASSTDNLTSIDKNNSILGAYLGIGYLPENGLNARFAAAYTKSNDTKYTWDDGGTLTEETEIGASVWGAYLNVSYVGETSTIGVAGVYASYDKDADAGFWFGMDFDMTSIIDNGFRDGSGVHSMTAAYLYGEHSLTDKLSLRAVAGYYTSNITGDKHGAALAVASNSPDNFIQLTKDTTAREVDIALGYKLYEDVTLELGGGYAAFDKLWNQDDSVQYNSDPIYQGWLTLDVVF